MVQNEAHAKTIVPYDIQSVRCRDMAHATDESPSRIHRTVSSCSSSLHNVEASLKREDWTICQRGFPSTVVSVSVALIVNDRIINVSAGTTRLNMLMQFPDISYFVADEMRAEIRILSLYIFPISEIDASDCVIWKDGIQTVDIFQEQSAWFFIV